MTWAWTYPAPARRLRTSRAFVGMVTPRAFSMARTEARAWTPVHTPQIRWAKSQASRGSRPPRMSSIPRNIVPELHASRTTPFAISTSMRRCPPTRVMGSITVRVISARLGVRGVGGVDGNDRVGAVDGDHVHAVGRAGLVGLTQLGGLGGIRRDGRLDRIGITAGQVLPRQGSVGGGGARLASLLCANPSLPDVARGAVHHGQAGHT